VGIEYLFSVAHELVIKSGHQAEVVKLRGKWVPIDPSTWKTGRDMRIVVGYGAGNKDALVSRLAMIRMAQLEALQLGLPNVTPQNLYETDVEIVKAADFSAPQRFWTDPSTVQPPPPQPPPDVIKAQIAAQSAEKIKAAEIDSSERIKQAELLQKDQQAQLQAEVTILVEQMKLGGNADLERIRGSLKNENERVKASLAVDGDEKKQIGQSVLERIETEAQKTKRERDEAAKRAESAESQLKELSGPREVVRENGKVVGVKIGSKVRSVIRDKENRIVGLQ
jgi:hypothetical protein